MKTLFACLVLSVALYGQAPLPLGTVSDPTAVICPSGFPGGAVCQRLTISCSGTQDIASTVGYKANRNPSGVGTGKTIFIMNGAPWSAPGLSPFVHQYLNDGYDIVQATWPSRWEETGKAPNLLIAACRPATLLNWVYRNYAPYGLRVHAASAGAGALAYALTWYGLDSEVATAELDSGPVYSDIVRGCETPAPKPVELIASDGTSWFNDPQYVEGSVGHLTTYTGHTCTSNYKTSSTTDEDWRQQSIKAPGGIRHFPNTHLAGWLCQTAELTNNAAAQGYLWLSDVTDMNGPVTINAILNCRGYEEVESGTWESNGVSGFEAILADMEAN